jgi:hypothetical protein
MLVTCEAGGSLSLRFDDLDSVCAPYPENDLWQLVLSIEATPMFLGRRSWRERFCSIDTPSSVPSGGARSRMCFRPGSMCADASSALPGSRRRRAKHRGLWSGIRLPSCILCRRFRRMRRMRREHPSWSRPSRSAPMRAWPLPVGSSVACSIHWRSCAPKSVGRASLAKPPRAPSRTRVHRRQPRARDRAWSPRRLRSRSISFQDCVLSRTPSARPSGVAPTMTNRHCAASSSRA